MLWARSSAASAVARRGTVLTVPAVPALLAGSGAPGRVPPPASADTAEHIEAKSSQSASPAPTPASAAGGGGGAGVAAAGVAAAGVAAAGVASAAGVAALVAGVAAGSSSSELLK